MNKSSTKIWILLFIPVVALFYGGLFLTMFLWYPAGLTNAEWQSHLLHFTIVYVLWLAVFVSYRLFDLQTLHMIQTVIGKLGAALVICLIIAVLYFYFQPALLITPRRFLLVHMLITGVGIFGWYIFIRLTLPHSGKSLIYVHYQLQHEPNVQELVEGHQYLGLKFAGSVSPNEMQDQNQSFSSSAIIVMPARADISENEARALFALRDQGIRFIEYHDLFENLTRTVHLSVLTDLWFINSIDYRAHKIFDVVKRVLDILAGLIAIVVWLITFPFIALAIKIESHGPILFKQPRVGLRGEIFTLYKYRSMSGGSTDTWTETGDSRITRVGKWLRRLRLDELPQSINILKGDMSLVGPRPEQVHIVEQLREQIPYYDERHIVKPGLTGWSQLHVYASSLEETRRKLQYDLYYIKHRSILFDMEIILKTVYNILTFAGR